MRRSQLRDLSPDRLKIHGDSLIAIMQRLSHVVEHMCQLTNLIVGGYHEPNGCIVALCELSSRVGETS